MFTAIIIDSETPSFQETIIHRNGERGIVNVSIPGTPIPARDEFYLDPAGIAKAQASHDYIMSLFAAAQKG